MQNTGPRLTVYLASAPGTGKTRRLLDDALRLQESGVRAAVGWIETKGRPDLDALAARLPRVPSRIANVGTSNVEDFDFDGAIAGKWQHVVLDELAHENLPGGRHRTRWEDALALREAGISVSGAFNVVHLETVTATAEGLVGYPIREIVPLSFLRAADHVIALDVSPEQLETRLSSGALRPQALSYLREVMLRTVGDLSKAAVTPRRASTALAFATGEGDTAIFLRKAAAVAEALDLALDVALVGERNVAAVGMLAKELDAKVVALDGFDPLKPKLGELKATLVALPAGDFAHRVLSRAIERDTLIVDSTKDSAPSAREAAFSRIAQTSADRMRIGYGRLTIYLGAAAGSGTTYAMLDRAHQLLEDGRDVVAAFVEPHDRSETVAKARGLATLARRELTCDGVPYSELDVDALLARKPDIALIDELAHSNAPCDEHRKRYDDVLQVLRAGISVMTTLNVKHLEGLNDNVYRLTGERVRETVPDEILDIADDVILIDTTPETLRERLPVGTIYGREQVAALRELALREVVHSRGAPKHGQLFTRLALGVKARERDAELIERSARLALRLEADLSVIHIVKNAASERNSAVAVLEDTARRVRARWSVAAGDDPAKTLVEAAKREGAGSIAVEGPRAKQRFSLGTPFSRRLLEAGAKQLFVLAPPD